MSLNYPFIVELAQKTNPPPAYLLDFGCGEGVVVREALRCGYDASGCDTYHGYWNMFRSAASQDLSVADRVSAVPPGSPLPYEDAAFDIVLANQVFEHVRDLDGARRELARVLRPSGHLIVMCPTTEIIWEPHLRAPLAHRCNPDSGMGRMGIAFLGYVRPRGKRQETHPQWMARARNALKNDVFYRNTKQYVAALSPSFDLISAEEPAWVRHRLRNHAKLARWGALVGNRAFDPALRMITRRLAGCVLVFQRHAVPS